MNNHKQFKGAAATPQARAKLKQVSFGGKPLEVSVESIRVGTQLTTRASVANTFQNQRVIKAIDVATRIQRTSAPTDLKTYAAESNRLI